MDFAQELSDLIDNALENGVKLEDVRAAIELELQQIKDGMYDEK
jgi:hypothetical protein